MKQKDSTENCYLTYSDELEGGGHLICSYNHPIGEECLMDEKDKMAQEIIDRCSK
jgi:hypothetical protein